MYMIYTVVKLKSWLRIILTTMCSMIMYSMVFAYMLPRFYEMIMTKQYFLVGALLPIAFIGSVIFDRYYCRNKQSFNETLKIYQKKHHQ